MHRFEMVLESSCKAGYGTMRAVGVKGRTGPRGKNGKMAGRQIQTDGQLDRQQFNQATAAVGTKPSWSFWAR